SSQRAGMSTNEAALDDHGVSSVVEALDDHSPVGNDTLEALQVLPKSSDSAHGPDPRIGDLDFLRERRCRRGNVALVELLVEPGDESRLPVTSHARPSDQPTTLLA